MICPYCGATVLTAAMPAVGGEETHPNIEFVIASAHEYVKRNEVKYGGKLSYSDKALMVKNLLDHIALLSASPPELRGRESVRHIAHRHCTCTCRGNPEVLQNHTNLCDEITKAILEYAATTPYKDLYE